MLFFYGQSFNLFALMTVTDLHRTKKIGHRWTDNKYEDPELSRLTIIPLGKKEKKIIFVVVAVVFVRE